MEKQKFTQKQRAFVEHYLKCGNAAEAARLAGYSKKTARSIGEENLTKPDIRALLDEKIAQAEAERIASAEEVLEYFSSIMRNEEMPISERTRAAEALAKRYGLFKENLQITGNLQVVVVDDIGEE